MTKDPSLGLDPAQERAFAALLGALCADAAALGFHWLYDVDRIAERGGDCPEFRAPQAADFAGVAGYFAHGGKGPGELSHYGETLLVAARALLQGEGRYRVRLHQAEFRACFGAGGTWEGYVDRPTRGTLENLRAGEERSVAAGEAAALAQGIAPEQAQALAARLLPQVRLRSGEALQAALQAATPPGSELEPETQAVADAMDAAWPEASGASDRQLPALSALLPLVVVGCDEANLAAALRVTHDDDEALAWGLVAAAGLRAALRGGSPAEASAAAREVARGPVAERLGVGLALGGSGLEVIGTLGRNCELGNGVPGLLHLVQGARDYAGPVRENVRAGGDSCGRALVLGGVLGAIYGVGGERGLPYPWLAKLAGLEEQVATCHALARLARA